MIEQNKIENKSIQSPFAQTYFHGIVQLNRLELLEKLQFGKDAIEQVKAMKDALAKLKELGINSLNDN